MNVLQKAKEKEKIPDQDWRKAKEKEKIRDQRSEESKKKKKVVIHVPHRRGSTCGGYRRS